MSEQRGEFDSREGRWQYAQLLLERPMSGASGSHFHIDLHLHSCFSDGVLSPKALLERATRAGIKILALTDHDTLVGFSEAQQAASVFQLELISGIEITSWFGGKELHILGYLLDPENKPLRELQERLKRGRVERFRAMGQRLRTLGYPLDVEKIVVEAKGNLGRPHLARAMLKANYVFSFEEAFDRFLGDKGPAYQPLTHLSSQEAIEMIHAAGGQAVLAHPGVEGIDEQIPELCRLGLDGLEVSHPSHSKAIHKHYAALAKRLGLIPTGGSDFHAEKNLMGLHGTQPEALEALKQRAAG